MYPYQPGGHLNWLYGPPSPHHFPQPYLNPNVYVNPNAFTPPPPLPINPNFANPFLSPQQPPPQNSNFTFGQNPAVDDGSPVKRKKRQRGPNRRSKKQPGSLPTTTSVVRPLRSSNDRPEVSNSASIGAQCLTGNRRQMLDKVDGAVQTIRSELVAARRNVSAWDVLQSALLRLNETCLGLKVEQVPSIMRLMVTEERVNAFIHCFVGVRSITSLYDLEVAICKCEDIENFEELGLGPLLRHPLVLQYFIVNSDTTQVFKITTEEIMVLVFAYLDNNKGKPKEKTVEGFLDFVVTKRPVASKEKLGIRIRTLGTLERPMSEARKSERATRWKALKELKQHYSLNSGVYPGDISSQKKRLDIHFRAISRQAELFSTVQKNFKYDSVFFSGLEDEDISNCLHEGEKKRNFRSYDKANSCTFMSTVGEKSWLRPNDPSSASGSQTTQKKRKHENLSSPISVPLKIRKFEKIEHDALLTVNDDETEEVTDNYLRMFITTWKKACKEQPVGEVLWSMLMSNNTRFKRTKRIMSMFSTYPLSGILNVAVSSIKLGMWDSMCDTFQTFGEQESNISKDQEKINLKRKYRWIRNESPPPKQDRLSLEAQDPQHFAHPESRQSTHRTPMPQNEWLRNECPLQKQDKSSLEAHDPQRLNQQSDHVEPCENSSLMTGKFSGVSVDDIMGKIATYFENILCFSSHEMCSDGKSPYEKIFILFKMLWYCELWLAEEFCVEKFTSLGYGEFVVFLEKYVHLMPQKICKFLIGDSSGECPLEVCMSHHHLVVLVSQALNSLWEDEKITKLKISSLLGKQFPSLSFQTTGNGSIENFLSKMGKQQNTAISKSVLFSMTLYGTNSTLKSSENCSENDILESTSENVNCYQKLKYDFVASRDAIAVLLRAPMMSDLNLWSHWDLLYAPSLGPLVPWLLDEVNTDELLCLVTKDGKVVRLDHSVTLDSFLEAALQGSSFKTAVNMLSLFSLVGGEKHAPVSLMKFHVQHAFEVILKTYLDGMEVHDNKSSLNQGKAFCGQKLAVEVASAKIYSNLHGDLTQMKIAESFISQFFLDCLEYLPAEFRNFAADVLLCGMQSVFKHAALAILDACSQIEQRLMLHGVGLSLGIVEWISDYHATLSSNTDLSISEASCSNAVRDTKDVSKKFVPSDQSMGTSVMADEHEGGRTDVTLTIGGAEVSDGRSGSGYGQQSNEYNDASWVIESIRRDEFGLDSSLLNVGSIMLKKQHARLGRALHCLSKELYSQDSHFLLELVQNADDNTYPTNEEPTLVFILQESGIVVLNNEQGFSAQNIRALCDIGSSTKKGPNAGYIGQKGIGFKSVFRVTDAPEIHSNGFHIKFDASEGHIGLVLPTNVPPCNVDLFSRLVSSDNDKPEFHHWNTCIVLPFRSKVSTGIGIKCIMNMFSDLHPSLLLFLHRIKCIRYKSLIDDSLTVMRKETLGDGIFKVSHGKMKTAWFVVSQKLHSDIFHGDVQTTEISIAFTLKDSDNGDNDPDLRQQPVFAFLPLRSYGLKFILQGDFVLPSSREEVDADSPWNQWLLSEFPGLFVNAERSFCSLPCFRENLGSSVAAYMSFVPLVGEVHGFFSSLPRLIISKLRMTNCLLLEGGNKEWVPPCKVMRGWNKQARSLFPDGLLQEHLGIGFMDKNIVLPDPLARSLGIAEYGPTILLQVMDSLCRMENGLTSMGIGWIASWLGELYAILIKSSVEASFDSAIEMGLIEKLRKIPFIPLSDGTYGAVVEGPIWLQLDALGSGYGDQHGLESFPYLYAKLRIVSSDLLFSSSVNMSSMDVTPIDKIAFMLRRIGVQQLSAHEILKVHILAAISDDRITVEDKNLMTDYVCFAMVHLQSSCSACHAERECIMLELQNKAYILTNNGFKRPAESPIHFSKEFGNPVNINKLINRVDMSWDEVDISYLKHPVTESLPSGLMKWRGFFQKIGIVDFVQVVQVERSFTDLSEAWFNEITLDKHIISNGFKATDWESPELVHILSLLTGAGNRKGCEYLLEVLDTLWDNCYSERTTGYFTSKSVTDRKSFKSSFFSTICDVQWVSSVIDEKLHYPRDLYHDCVAVRSVLGASAPYFVPKARSEKFVADMSFKKRVSLHDALEILKIWRCENPFRASLAQMSKLYSLIRNEVASSKKTIAEFNLGSFIFVPYESSSNLKDVVTGTFLSPEDAYWDDSTSFVHQIKQIHRQCSSKEVNHAPINKFLFNFYPALQDFFVDICGVHKIPPLHSYLQLLLQLSNVALPSHAANAVFQVFLKWTAGLKLGLSAEDINYLKDSLTRIGCTVLPTAQDKWVSLHPSFGLVCWCDDEKLRKQFMRLDGVHFLYFGELSKDDEEILCTKMHILMQTLGIPALSEVVTREAIFYGPTDPSFKAALLDWALPYAQRYLHSLHPDKYFQLKQSGFDIPNRLRLVEVQKLFYRNVIKIARSESQQRVECNCLLQGYDLYTTQESDSHALFMELSRLFFDGKPDLPFANFLHMIATMDESGSTEEQTEFFILTSQHVPKLPDRESVWSLSYEHPSNKNDKSPQPSNLSPIDWKTPPDFGYANIFKEQARFAQPSSALQHNIDDSSERDKSNSMSVGINWTVDKDSATTSFPLVPDSTHLHKHLGDENEYDDMHMKFDPVNLYPPEFAASDCSNIQDLRYGTSMARDAMLTGRLGELVAFKYLIAKLGKSVVKWVNQGHETGEPYDIVVGEKEDSLEFIEVKATQSRRKDWFHVSTREWQFAVDKGEAYSILHVLLLGNNAARVSVYKNPLKLCQMGKLQLHVAMPKQERELFIVS